MEILPAEIIAAIAQYLDIVSLVRISRTSWRVYEIVQKQIDQLMIPRRRALDEINAIRYDVYSRKLTSDGNGLYCSVREIRGRLIGSFECVSYDYIAGNELHGHDEIIIFSDRLIFTKDKYDQLCPGNANICGPDDLTDKQLYITYSTHVLTCDILTWKKVKHATGGMFGFVYHRTIFQKPQCNRIIIGTNSPTIINGNLQWI
jgi:hypothetical protein